MRRDYIPVAQYQPSKYSATRVDILDYLAASYTNMRQDVQSTVLHKVTENDATHPDLISFKYYEREDLWWIICMYNSIVNPLTELTVGKVLRIPNLVEVNNLLTQAEQQSSTSSVVTI